MTIEKRPLKVFLCHSSHDKAIVRELYQRLNSESWIDPWLDEENLYPGQDWDLEIEKAVETADAVIICLSNNSVSKEGYLQRELRFVLRIADYKPEGTVFVIPVRLDDCHIPRRLEIWQYVDYFPESRQDWAYQRLLGSLKVRAQKLGIPTADPLAEAKARQEKQEREASEKAAREKSEREAAQKAAREKAEREAAQKAAREKAEHEAADKAAREKAAQAATGNNAPFDDVLGKPVKPFPVEQKAFEKPPRKLKPEYIIAIIGAVATILAALIGVLPQIIKPAPVPTATIISTATVTRAPTVTLTPTVTNTPVLPTDWILFFVSDGNQGTVQAFNLGTKEIVHLNKTCENPPIWLPAKKRFLLCGGPEIYEFENGIFSKKDVFSTTLDGAISNNVDTLFYVDNSKIFKSDDFGQNIQIAIYPYDQIIESGEIGACIVNGKYLAVSGNDAKWSKINKYSIKFLAMSPDANKVLYEFVSWTEHWGAACHTPRFSKDSYKSQMIVHNIQANNAKITIPCDTYLYWSKDGNIVVCKNGAYSITGNAETEPYPELTEYDIFMSFWSHDLSKMAFIAKGDIFVFDEKSKNVNQITSQGNFESFSWLPKGDGSFFQANRVTLF